MQIHWIQRLYLQPLLEGLCKSALQSPENGESKRGVIIKTKIIQS